MPQTTLPRPEIRVHSEDNKCDIKENELLNPNLFKPPKSDTNFFYYTEVPSDWIAMKK